MEFESTYAFLVYLCRTIKSDLKIELCEKYTTELYPEFFFGSDQVKEQLFSPIMQWFHNGSGVMAMKSCEIIFFLSDEGLDWKYGNIQFDFDSYPEYSQLNDWLMDIEHLKDGEIYTFG